jgi:hypothetical protein
VEFGTGVALTVGRGSLRGGQPRMDAQCLLKYARQADGTPQLPAMPPDMFDMDLLTGVKTRFMDCNKLQFEAYQCNAQRVFNAPLKSGKVQDNGDGSSLYGFYPCEISKDYVGSNNGLHLLLKTHVETRLPDGKYSLINMDINPIWRIYKVG